MVPLPDFRAEELVPYALHLLVSLLGVMTALIVWLIAWRGAKAARVMAGLVMLAGVELTVWLALDAGASWWLGVPVAYFGWVAWRSWGAERPRLGRFDLRGLMVFVAAFALVLAGIVSDGAQAQRHQQFADQLTKLGAYSVERSFGTVYGVTIFEPLDQAALTQVCDVLAQTSIRRLQIAGSNLGDDACRQLARLPSLESLSMQHAVITGAGLTQLGTLKSLESLEIEGSGLQDADLASLENLKRLRKLWIYHGQLSPTALDQLHRALPRYEP